MSNEAYDVIVMTSDVSQNRVAPGFVYLFNKYWGASQKVKLVGYTAPKFKLPKNFEFHSLGRFADYPANKWSNSLMRVLNEIASEVFVLLLDDYWLVRDVDLRAMKIIRDYMFQFQNVIKFDLCTDRLYSDPNRYFYGFNTHAHAGYLDLIKSPPGSNYHMSLWGGMWRRDLMKKIIVPDETAQQIELNGTGRLSGYGDNMLVFGTRQSPLKHGNIIQSSKRKPVYADGGWAIEQAVIEDMREKELLKYLE